MEVMDAMSRRRSCRAYLPQQILNEKRDEILKAANAAPVGMGEYQNVRLSVIQSAARPFWAIRLCVLHMARPR